MKCEDIRQSLSAQLDGEEGRIAVDVVDAHLAGCAAWQQWFSRVSALGRDLKVHAAGQQLTPSTNAHLAAARVLDAAGDLPQLTGGLRARQLPFTIARVTVGVLAAVYIIWAGLLLFGADPGIPSPGEVPATAPYAAAEDPQLARFVIDAATVRCALGVGLAWACYRPRAAGHILPIFLVMWAFGAGFATRDVVLGAISDAVDVTALIAGLVVHLLAAVGLVVLMFSRLHTGSPLGQSLRILGARPATFSPADLHRNSSFRPGDRPSERPSDKPGGELGEELGDQPSGQQQ